MTTPKKVVKELYQVMEADGYRVEYVGRTKHHKFIVHRDGVQVSVSVPHTPSDVRWLKNLRSQVARSFAIAMQRSKGESK